jgi:hypothetical protein
MHWLAMAWHNMAHPHGWWWLVDLVLLGTSTTVGISIANDN